jgi:hypothetical protein
MKDVSFDITNNAEDHRVLHLEPLGLKFGIDSGDCYLLTIHGDAPFEMYLGDDDEGIYIEFMGDVDFSLTHNGEKIQSGYNLKF